MRLEMMRAVGCLQHIRVLRVLCREEFSVSAAKTFVEDVKRAMQWLTGHFMYTPEQVRLTPTQLPTACTLMMAPLLMTNLTVQ